MNTRIFDDIPGVGEIYLYRNSDRKDYKGRIYYEKNYWIDNLAFKLLNRNEPLLYKEFESIVGGIDAQALVDIPFIKIDGRYIAFAAEKFHIAAILVAFYESFIKGEDLDLLDTLMPYDIISYLRPAITADDGDKIIKAIEKSQNNHYIRFLFLLLRRCGVEGNDDWKNWLKKYIEELSCEINSYSEFTVQRDARVTLTTIKGKESLFPFVERIMNEPKLVEYETRHFIESLGTPERAGDVIYWKIVEAGYRQNIAPINVFSLHQFPSKHIKKLLADISENHEHEKMREIASEALKRML